MPSVESNSSATDTIKGQKSTEGGQSTLSKGDVNENGPVPLDQDKVKQNNIQEGHIDKQPLKISAKDEQNENANGTKGEEIVNITTESEKIACSDKITAFKNGAMPKEVASPGTNKENNSEQLYNGEVSGSMDVKIAHPENLTGVSTEAKEGKQISDSEKKNKEITQLKEETRKFQSISTKEQKEPKHDDSDNKNVKVELVQSNNESISEGTKNGPEQNPTDNSGKGSNEENVHGEPPSGTKGTTLNNTKANETNRLEADVSKNKKSLTKIDGESKTSGKSTDSIIHEPVLDQEVVSNNDSSDGVVDSIIKSGSSKIDIEQSNGTGTSSLQNESKSPDISVSIKNSQQDKHALKQSVLDETSNLQSGVTGRPKENLNKPSTTEKADKPNENSMQTKGDINMKSISKGASLTEVTESTSGSDAANVKAIESKDGQSTSIEETKKESVKSSDVIKTVTVENEHSSNITESDQRINQPSLPVVAKDSEQKIEKDNVSESKLKNGASKSPPEIKETDPREDRQAVIEDSTEQTMDQEDLSIEKEDDDENDAKQPPDEEDVLRKQEDSDSEDEEQEKNPSVIGPLVNKFSSLSQVVDKIREAEGAKEEETQEEISERERKESLLLRGVCPLNEIPPLNKKVVRIFLSSTFSDTKEERNALMRHVYPRLTEYCREKHGLEFQVVDMRWGVPEQASDNHSTTDLCLSEINKCQELSMGPNFVVILGHKYGYRPLPNQIIEEHFKMMEQVSGGMGVDLSLVSAWYRRDENAKPPVYLLQPVSSMIENYGHKEDAALRQEASKKWKKIETELQQTIRKLAFQANKLGKMSDLDTHMFFMSVTEAEVTRGVAGAGDKKEEACVCFLRNIPDITSHLKEQKAQKFIDLEATGDEPSIDSNAQKLLEELKEHKIKQLLPEEKIIKCEIGWNSSGAAIQDVDAVEDISAAVASQKWRDREIDVAKHKEYLDSFCKRFHDKVKELVNTAVTKGGDRSNNLLLQVCQHWETAKTRCQVFEGREDVLEKIKDYTLGTSHLPFVIYGTSGCGKTSVLAKAAEKAPDWFGGSSAECFPTVVVRFLGTTADSSNIMQVLTSIGKQLHHVYKKAWIEPQNFSDAVALFTESLSFATADKPTVVFIDSLDQLYPAYQAFKLRWLPKKLQAHTKLVLSVLDKEYNLLERLQQLYPEDKAQYVEVPQLGLDVGMVVIAKWLSDANRTVTKQQNQVIHGALKACSLPLYARIVFDQVLSWRSFDEINPNQLQTTVKGAINKLFEQLEIKFSVSLVKHCLSYLTASRNGLSEAEMDHILSIDDTLLSKMYKFWKPPIRRIPPLLWSRVRADINNYIVERSADGANVLYWYHRQFIMSAKERYLAEKEFSWYIHGTMADYFLGKWGGGKKKGFQYTQAQLARFGLTDAKCSEDRKVPLQPYVYEGSSSDRVDLRFNLRKMSELPFHLIKSKDYNGLKSHVIFNYEYLHAKMASSSVHELAQEIEFFSLDKRVRKDKEVNVILATLRLVQPYVGRFPESFPLELSARLLSYMEKSLYVKTLIQQCDTIATRVCPLVPLVSCFETASVGIQQNITIRSSQPWQKSGTIVCSKDFQTLYVLDVNDEGKFHISSWDLSTNEKIRDLPFEMDIAQDIVFQATFHLPSNTLMIFTYRKFRDHGRIQIVDVETGKVLHSMDEFVYKKGFFNPLVFTTQNFIAARFGWKVILWRFKDTKSIVHNRPTALTHNEEFFIIAQCDQVRMRLFKTKENISVFEDSAGVTAIAIGPNVSNLKAFLGCQDPKLVKMYKIGNPWKGKIFKAKRFLSLDKVKDIRVTVLEDVRLEKEKPHVKKIIPSPDNDHIIVVYSGISDWEALLWRTGIKTCTRITFRRGKHERYPCFSFDGAHVIDVKDNEVKVVQVKNGTTVSWHAMKTVIRDFTVSPCSNQYALMLEKEIVIMNIGGTENRGPQGKKVQQGFAAQTGPLLKVCDPLSVPGLPSEPGLNLKQESDRLELQFQQSGYDVGDEDRPCSVMSLAGSRSTPRATWLTPDKQTEVQLHAKIQVIDGVAEDIRYTPHRGDVVQRTVQSQPNAAATIETVQIRGNEIFKGLSSLRLELRPGDRIVQTETMQKTKYTVPRTGHQHVYVEKVPSLVRIKNVDPAVLSRKFTTFQESHLCISNKFLVNSKRKKNGEFLKVYDLKDGSNKATHEVTGSCAAFAPQENRLYVVDNNLNLRIYPGPHFSNCASTISLQSKKSKDKIAKEILQFPSSQDLVVIRLASTGLMATDPNMYVSVNVVSQVVAKAVSVKAPMEDISSDGQLAISHDLVLFDLVEGKQVQKLDFPYRDENSQLQARISDDKFTIFVTDKQDNTFYLLQGEDFRVTFRCYTHGNSSPLTDHFFLKYSGRAVVTEGSGLKMLILAGESLFGRKELPMVLDYDSEQTRAASLVDYLQHASHSRPTSGASERTEAVN